jgi:hypothetical protein
MPGMRKLFEYRLVTTIIALAPSEVDKTEKLFNDMGQEGWELVAMQKHGLEGQGGRLQFYFKRELGPKLAAEAMEEWNRD